MARFVPGQRIRCADPRQTEPNGMARRFIDLDPEDEKVSYSERREGRCCCWPEEEISFEQHQQHPITSGGEPFEVDEVDEDNENEDKDDLPSLHGKSPMRATVPPNIRRPRPSAARQHTSLVLHLAHAGE